MPTIGNISVPASTLTSQIHATITVKGIKVMRFRFWLGTHLFRLAAAVMGFGGVTVDVDTSHKQPR